MANEFQLRISLMDYDRAHLTPPGKGLISVVKAVRQRMGVPLKQAKAIVDGWEAQGVFNTSPET